MEGALCANISKKDYKKVCKGDKTKSGLYNPKHTIFSNLQIS
ncbi:hypothetical protein ACWEXT_02510 [Staphylococcus xylosus]